MKKTVIQLINDYIAILTEDEVYQLYLDLEKKIDVKKYSHKMLSVRTK